MTMLKVTSKTVAADGVVLLHLAAPDASPLPEWTPGAHIDLVLGDGIIRPYSLSGDPDDRGEWRLGVLREENSRGGSAYLHDHLQPGHEIEVRGPRNNFALHPARQYLFIAGGIGITPLLPMIAYAHRQGADWRLLYGGRSRASMAFLDELEVYGDRVRVVPQDEEGLLDLDTVMKSVTEETQVYCCGPEGLLAAVEGWSDRLPNGGVHVERFRGLPLEDAVWEGPFEVVFQQSGITAVVEPDQQIIEVAEEEDIPVLYSCAEGTCGSCETTVLAGAVHHRDSYLSPQERTAGDRMMICVSRSAGPRLVLDL
ncbi:PDR/VanB family oxidoreductase [Plantactinospora sp. GCM10030261]|uniref:PDR/VanB family oxidoreductase n=1 Tax=Plantactinospora sp. GCM10030261 TaxID=3273420 RepID=UPI00360A0E1D